MSALKVKGTASASGQDVVLCFNPGVSGYNPPWFAAATIFIDPQNTSGTASDSANGTGAGTALLTWKEAVRRWGTVAPYLTVTLVITFLSSHTNNTDPVEFAPRIGQGANITIQGTAPASTPAVFTLNAAKNRAAGTNALLSGSFSAGVPAAGVLVQNTTAAKSSRAWVYKTAGGINWNMSQPLVPATIGGTVNPAEFDGWASTDTVNVLVPVAVNLTRIAPVQLDTFGESTLSATNLMTLYQLTGFSPNGAGNSITTIDQTAGAVELREVAFQRQLRVIGAEGPYCSFVNVACLGGAVILANVNISGGFFSVFVVSNSQGVSAGAVVDGDAILGTFCNINSGVITFGLVFLDCGVTAQAAYIALNTENYGSHVLYGSGANTINLTGTSHMFNASGTFTAATTAPGLITGTKLSGTATGSSHTGATPDVLASAISTTPAHLDAGAGPAGFGGNAFNLGGPSFSNAA